MTHPLALTGNRLEIAARLRAGQSIEKITEIGWWRRSWTRQEVLRVGWLLTFEQAEDSKPGPPPRPRPDAGTVRLSARLTQTCEYVCGGYTNEEIARRMGVTAKSASRYRHQLAKVLGIPAADIAWAVETGRVVVEGMAA